MSILDQFHWSANPNSSALLFASATELSFLILVSIVILSVPRNAPFTRLASLLPLIASTYTLQETIPRLCQNPHWRAAAVPLLWIQCLSASEMIWVSRVDSTDLTTSTRRESRASRASRAIALIWNLRRVGTKWEVKNIPALKSPSPSSSPSSRARFLSRRLTATILAYLILDAMISAPPPDPSFVRPGKETLFRLDELTSDDLVFRTLGTVSFWLSTALLNLLMSNGVAILCVLTGLSEPTHCPPLYGPIGEAYTMRRYWGISWHQCLRQGLTGHADAITDLLLPISQTGPLSRSYTRLTLSFLISGLIHHSSDLAMGIPRSAAGSLFFFLLQPLGIMIEDGVQHLLMSRQRRVVVVGSGGIVSSRRRRGWGRRIVGYVWVLAFLTWSTPTWFYPQQRLGIDAGNLLPVRVVGPLIGWIQNV